MILISAGETGRNRRKNEVTDGRDSKVEGWDLHPFVLWEIVYKIEILGPT